MHFPVLMAADTDIAFGSIPEGLCYNPGPPFAPGALPSSSASVNRQKFKRKSRLIVFRVFDLWRNSIREITSPRRRSYPPSPHSPFPTLRRICGQYFFSQGLKCLTLVYNINNSARSRGAGPSKGPAPCTAAAVIYHAYSDSSGFVIDCASGPLGDRRSEEEPAFDDRSKLRAAQMCSERWL